MKIMPTFESLIQSIRQARQTMAEEKAHQRFIAFMKRLPETQIATAHESEDEVGFLILPWPTFTLLPCYIIALALAFAWHGRKVHIIWDDTQFGPLNLTQRLLQLRIQRTLANVPPPVRVSRLSKFAAGDDPVIGNDTLHKLAEMNAIRHFLADLPVQGSSQYIELIKECMRRTAACFQGFLRKHTLRYLVVPGGVYRSTGLVAEISKRTGLRVASFDSGNEVLLVSTEGVAAHLDDIVRAFRALPEEDDSIILEAKAELQKRMTCKDRFTYQAVATNTLELPSYAALIALNQNFDTAALGKHRVFRNQTEWMLETVGWMLEHSTGLVAIRRHPVERLPRMRSNDDYAGSLTERFGRDPRIEFIDANALVNTYDLMQNSKVVLPHVSTVGVEAAALGIPVVTQSESYYADLDFVWSARTREEYFNLLGRALAGQLHVSESQRSAAWRCYFLTQCCNFYPTNFNPRGFEKWVEQDPATLFSCNDVMDLSYAIDTNLPIPTLTLRKRQGLLPFQQRGTELK